MSWKKGWRDGIPAVPRGIMYTNGENLFFKKNYFRICTVHFISFYKYIIFKLFNLCYSFLNARNPKHTSRSLFFRAKVPFLVLTRARCNLCRQHYGTKNTSWNSHRFMNTGLMLKIVSSDFIMKMNPSLYHSMGNIIKNIQRRLPVFVYIYL
jgi:hypothetical protein